MATLKATTYSGLARLLERKTKRTIGNNTTAELTGPIGSYAIMIRLHGHPIVVVNPDDSCTFNMQGYATVTTCERINQFLPAGRSVFQKDGEQYWNQGGDADPVEIDPSATYEWRI